MVFDFFKTAALIYRNLSIKKPKEPMAIKIKKVIKTLKILYFNGIYLNYL